MQENFETQEKFRDKFRAREKFIKNSRKDLRLKINSWGQLNLLTKNNIESKAGKRGCFCPLNTFPQYTIENNHFWQFSLCSNYLRFRQSAAAYLFSSLFESQVSVSTLLSPLHNLQNMISRTVSKSFDGMFFMMKLKKWIIH